MLSVSAAGFVPWHAWFAPSCFTTFVERRPGVLPELEKLYSCSSFAAHSTCSLHTRR